jgi:glucokinase
MRALGIDIGATSIKTVLFNEGAIKSSIVPTPKNKKALLKAVAEIIYDAKTIDGKSAKLDRFGVGFAGVVDLKSGKLSGAPNLPFMNGFNLGAYLKSLHSGAKINNDAKCALLAELKFGHAAKFKNSVLIAIGTGIGGGVLINGEMYYGQGAAGELGHIILDRGKTYENLAGGKALKHYGPSEIAKVGLYTGMACVNIVRILNPDVIILSGGVVVKNPRIAKDAAKIMKRHLPARYTKSTKILVSKLGEFAGAIGAAWL